MYVKCNENPKNKKVGDCVIRTLAKSLDMTWMEVYKYLTAYSMHTYTMPNDAETYRTFLTDCGATHTSIKVTKGSKRGTVKQFALNHPKGNYILEVANHVVAVVDGNYYDTWDCGNKSLYSYWNVSTAVVLFDTLFKGKVFDNVTHLERFIRYLNFSITNMNDGLCEIDVAVGATDIRQIKYKYFSKGREIKVTEVTCIPYY